MASKVSVIIPCYNGASFIDRSIKSIYEQEYDSLELIVVDDGSNDNSKSLIMKWEKPFSSKGWILKYIYERNRGLGGAVETGLASVEGDYLTLLDADDYYLPGAIEKKAVFLDRHKDYSGVRSNGWVMQKDGSKRPLIVSQKEKSDEDLFSALIYGTTNNWAGTYMIRTSLLFEFYKNKEFFPSRYGQNLQLLLPVSYGRKFGFIDEPLFVYCLQENSLSQSADFKNQFRKSLSNGKGYREIYEYMLRIILKDKPVEYQRYLNAFNASYYRTRMNDAMKYKDKKICAESYKEIKKTGLLTLNDQIGYYSFIAPGIAVMLKVKRKVSSLRK